MTMGFMSSSAKTLRHRAVNWADDHGINESVKNDLLNWLEALPWRDDMVMLHLGR